VLINNQSSKRINLETAGILQSEICNSARVGFPIGDVGGAVVFDDAVFDCVVWGVAEADPDIVVADDAVPEGILRGLVEIVGLAVISGGALDDVMVG